MYLSPLVRRIALCCALAALVFSGQAQTGFVTNGGEYNVTGPLFSEQMRPRVGLGSGGGLLVYQDNVTDARGLGVSALALNSDFQKVGAPFRVNAFGVGDQELPHVALLKDGGAVFVWQGGKQGFQHIYARFLSSSNTWAGSDVLVNSSPNGSQFHPDIALLANGNIAVVWSSYNQSGPTNLHDIYCQLLSPAGTKVGSEFLVNQFTAYAQKTPAIAALAGGGFVVTWVSDQQRAAAPLVPANSSINLDFPALNSSLLPSVDVYARIFDNNSVPLTDEFLVNTSINYCMHPAVGGASDGSFMVAWTERNPHDTSTGLDIYARPFSSSGTGGAASRVNVQVANDQFEPQLAASGNDYLLAWTSFGQDGSREGVFGRFLLSDGTADGGEFRVNTTVAGSQRQQSVAADNYGRFLSVWSGFIGGGSSFDIFGQGYAIPGFTPPAPTALFQPPASDAYLTNDPPLNAPDDGWPTGQTNWFTGIPLLQFPAIASHATDAVAQAFSAAKGTYSGLFYDETNGVSPSTAGYFTATTTEKGKYSAKILMNGKTYSWSGLFDSSGVGSAMVLRGSERSLVVNLLLDLYGGDQITGTVSDRHWNAALVADRQVFNKKTRPASAYSGSYTMVIPGAGSGSKAPVGAGFGSLKIDLAGGVGFAGSLADGTKIAQKTGLSGQGIWPLYSGLYSGKGCVISWIQMTNNSSGPGGPLIWMKAAHSPNTKSYGGGFTNGVTAAGSPYQPPKKGQSLLDWPAGKGEMVLSDGGLTSWRTNLVQLDTKNKILYVGGEKAGGSKFTFTLTPSTGLFKGISSSPGWGKVQFQGALFQLWNTGAGYFLGATNGSGQLYLGPVQ